MVTKSGYPLLDMHVKAGAVLGETCGLSPILSYGTVEVEYESFTSSAAILDRSHTGRLTQSGRDALDLLNRLSTNKVTNVRELEPVTTILTSASGRIVDVVTVICRSTENVLLLTLSSYGMKAFEWINRYKFEEDAELANLSQSTVRFALAGPTAADILDATFGDCSSSVAAGRVVVKGILDKEVLVMQNELLGQSGFDILVDVDLGETLWSKLVNAGAVPVGHLAYNSVRIEQGHGEFNSEFSEQYNPLEAGLRKWINFEKGCYVGQEVIARLDTYDKVKRRLVGVVSNNRLPIHGSLQLGGRIVGKVTSSAFSPGLGKQVGLAYVRKTAAESGTMLNIGSDKVRVVTVPMV